MEYTALYHNRQCEDLKPDIMYFYEFLWHFLRSDILISTLCSDKLNLWKLPLRQFTLLTLLHTKFPVISYP
jgi:hypothetical protein